MNRTSHRIVPTTRALLFFCLVPLTACGDSLSGASEPVEATTVQAPTEPVVREIMGQVGDPAGATGQRLSLVRYTIAPGAELAPHIHPGVQMGSIVSGTLSYRVVSGTVTIHRRVDANGAAATVEQVVGPADTELREGDTVVEDATMVHFGANRTNEPVIILAALLTDSGADLSLPAAPTDP